MGRTLAAWFAPRGYEVIVLTRRGRSDGLHARCVEWDARSGGAWEAELEGAAAVVNLAGRSVDCRYTARNRRAMIDSRVDSTRILGAAIASCSAPPPVWPGAAQPSAQAGSGESGGLAYEAYSPERLAALRAEGKAVFVNYTAAWCVTCQVNERVAFSTQTAANAFKSSGTVYLKADWTRRDSVIAEDLARFGRAGVPLYLVYPAGGGEPKILSQLLTPDIVARAVKEAARG